MNDFKIHNAMNMYREYVKANPSTIVSYKMFKEIISDFNKRASEHILKGATLRIGHKMGNIRIKKIERNCLTIDWGETNKLKAKGINKLVYFTDDYYFRWFWEKSRCQARNKSVYRFTPTAGPSGNRRALVNILKTDEFAITNYKL